MYGCDNPFGFKVLLGTFALPEPSLITPLVLEAAPSFPSLGSLLHGALMWLAFPLRSAPEPEPRHSLSCLT